MNEHITKKKKKIVGVLKNKILSVTRLRDLNEQNK